MRRIRKFLLARARDYKKNIKKKVRTKGRVEILFGVEGRERKELREEFDFHRQLFFAGIRTDLRLGSREGLGSGVSLSKPAH